MDNGTYKAKKDLSIIGLFSMTDVNKGQIISVEDGDHEDTVFVETSPFCKIELYRDHNFSNLELLD